MVRSHSPHRNFECLIELDCLSFTGTRDAMEDTIEGKAQGLSGKPEEMPRLRKE